MAAVTLPEPVFNRLAALAAHLFDAPLAAIEVRGHRSWLFKVGDLADVEVVVAPLLIGVAPTDAVIVPDTAADGRFAAADYAIAGQVVRFFASAPLIDGDGGEVIGALRVVDLKPHDVASTRNGQALADIACLIVQQLCLAEQAPHAAEAASTQAALRASEGQFQRLVNGVTDYALYMLSPEGIVTNWNAGAERIKGYTADEVVGQHYEKFYTREDRAAGAPARNLRTATEKGRFETNGWRARKDGSLFWANVVIDPIYDENGHLIGFAKITRDISERREYEARLHRLAHFDTLTDLPNRFALKSRLELALGGDAPVAALMLDLDGFKAINDTLGHPAGDYVLKRAGERLRRCVGDKGTVGRLGGDEFAVVLPGLGDPAAASGLCRMLVEAFRLPFNFQRQDLYVGLSIGIAIGPSHGNTAEQLLANADLALYQAKSEGLYGFHLFQPMLRQAAIARSNCERKLRQAVDQGALELYYQPKVGLPDGKVVGAEALLRWHHPERGLLVPKAFIDVLDRSALAPTVGDWAIRTACAHAARMRSLGLPNFRVAVNLFGAQFRKARLVSTVTQALRDSGLDPDGLELEITENIIWRQDDVLLKPLQDLKAMGVRASLDDFGTGYASLSLLKRFPLAGLKIDKSFVADMCEDRESSALVQAVVYLADCFGLEVTAEGVETPKQEEALRRLGCAFGQGYLYGRPMPVSELQALLLTGLGPSSLQDLDSGLWAASA